MFFWTLLLAHIIADFPLQTDTIYRLKTRYTWGVLPHVFICTVINTLALLPYLQNINTWIAIVFLAAVHIVLDRTKISVSEKIARDNFIQFSIDQFLHILSIWLAAVWLNHTIDVSSYQVSNILANRQLMIQLVALIFATFAGVPIVFYAIKYWRHHLSEPAHDDVQYPTFLRRVPGHFERFLSTLCVIWGGWWWLLAVGVFIPRIILNWKEDRSAGIVSAITGFIICLCCGLAVKILV